MTLDEAIKHAEEVAKGQKESAEMWHSYPESHYDNHLAQKAYNSCKKCAEEHQQLAEWLKELKQLREQVRWILCSERMPKEREWSGTKRFGTTMSNKVYVTLENLKGERYTKHLCFQNGKLSPADQQEVDAFFNGGIPIAWMPLPKPYQSKIPTGSVGSDKVNCDKTECYNCVNHSYCDYEAESDEE